MGVLDKFLDVMKLNGDDDEYDDDFYDEDDDFEDESYEEEKPKKNIFGKKDKPAAYEEEEEDYQLKKSGRSNKVTPMRQPSTRRNAPAMEVCVIKPNAMDDTREITETLLAGRTVILNLEGMDLEIAQRIIDFTSGSALCLLEHIFLQHTFLLQLKKNTLLVGMHQVLRRILLGKPVFLDDRHRNISLRKQLFLNLVLHITYRFLRDQMGTVNINLDMISG